MVFKSWFSTTIFEIPKCGNLLCGPVQFSDLRLLPICEPPPALATTRAALLRDLHGLIIDELLVGSQLNGLLVFEELFCQLQQHIIRITAEVSQGDQVLPTAKKTKPAIALLDIEMPGTDGLSSAKALHKDLPSCRILILTTLGRIGYLRRAMESGEVGFLLKDAPADQLAIAIRRLIAGERLVDPKLALIYDNVLPLKSSTSLGQCASQHLETNPAD